MDVTYFSATEGTDMLPSRLLQAPDQHPLMTALGRGLPISLLIDLVDPFGPRSLEMFEREGAAPAGAVVQRRPA
jgi:hypothetical protein